MSTPESYARPHIPFEDVQEAIEIYLQETHEYSGSMFILEVSKDPGYNTVKDGKLIVPDKDQTTFTIPTESDIEVLQAQKDAADEKLRSTVGLPEHIDIVDFWCVVNKVTLIVERADPSSRESSFKQYWLKSIPFELQTFGTMKNFFNTVQSLARITGDSYSTWLGFSAESYTDIGSETDVEALVEQAREIDNQILKFLQSNPIYTEQAERAAGKMQLIYEVPSDSNFSSADESS